jgi:putative heme-binding domain-containing protein
MEPGRSYGAAKQMFTVAACVACHKMDGVGQNIGPDLTKLDAKLTPSDILREILEPSKKIDEKYRTEVIITAEGKSISGLVIEENDTVVKLVQNPLASADATEIPKDEIEDRQKSPVSIMPQGALDKLTRDEILDLIAYLAARGDPKHPLFRGSGHAHGGHDHGGH